MGILDFFLPKPKSANVAKERLQIILAHERAFDDGDVTPDFIPRMQQEILEVIMRYMPIRQNDVKINLVKQDSLEVLELNVSLNVQDRIAASHKKVATPG